MLSVTQESVGAIVGGSDGLLGIDRRFVTQSRKQFFLELELLIECLGARNTGTADARSQ